MEFKSTMSEKNSLADLMNIDAVIREVVVISAYIDFHLIEELLKTIRRNSDKRGYPKLRVFTDRHASRFFTNKKIHTGMLKITKTIKNNFSEDSGIYLVRYGDLFHSKCLIFKGNAKGRIITGSLNFTQKALTKNEELILVDDFEIGSKQASSRLSDWIESSYLPTLILKDKSDKIEINSKSSITPLNLRQMLLEGNIFYELKEQDPFRFPLKLPDKAKENKSANLHPFLDSIITDSLSVKKLIEGKEQDAGLDYKLPVLPKDRGSWRRFCVNTCYGYWNPVTHREMINDAIKKRRTKRTPHYDKLKKAFCEKEEELSDAFQIFACALNKELEGKGFRWDDFSEEQTFIRWNRWYDNLKKKLNNKEFFDRLVIGVWSAETPDLWDDPVSSMEFEDSFLESLIYSWSKVARNVAKVALKNLNLDEPTQMELDTIKLKVIIEKWLKQQNRLLFQSDIDIDENDDEDDED